MTVFAGSRALHINDEENGIAFPALVLYPTCTPAAPVSMGPYTMALGVDAPPAAGQFPVVLISHGGGGSHLAYRTIAAYLAQRGYVVVLPQHHGNNRNDNSLSETIENLQYRPRHLRLALDAVCADAHLAAHVQQDQAAVVGHSMGAYTALAIAGGEPYSRDGRRVAVAADPRIRALVLMAPAAAWYQARGALRNVTAPMLILSGERDTVTPLWHAQLVQDGVADRTRVDSRVVANAGHFSFLSPFPAAMSKPEFLPSTDPAGFDRAAFHERLNPELLAFLERQLKPR